MLATVADHGRDRLRRAARKEHRVRPAVGGGLDHGRTMNTWATAPRLKAAVLTGSNTYSTSTFIKC